MDNPVKENLKKLMEADGKISEGELSRRTGIPQTTIHRILTGQIKESKPSTLRPIAEYYGLSLAELQEGALPPVSSALDVHRNAELSKSLPPHLTLPPAHSAYQVYLNNKAIEDFYKNQQHSVKPKQNMHVGAPAKLVPLINWELATVWKKRFKNYKHESSAGWVATNKDVGANAYGLIIQGNSMVSSHGPSFEDGCEIVVDPERIPKHSDFVVVKQSDKPNAILRQLSIEGGSLDLLPLNPRYTVTHLNSLDDICGVVCQLLANF